MNLVTDSYPMLLYQEFDHQTPPSVVSETKEIVNCVDNEIYD